MNLTMRFLNVHVYVHNVYCSYCHVLVSTSSFMFPCPGKNDRAYNELFDLLFKLDNTI